MPRRFQGRTSSGSGTRSRRSRKSATRTLVSYVDSGEAGTAERVYHYVVMELLNGKSLRQVLDDEGKLPPARAMDIGRQIARGVVDCASLRERSDCAGNGFIPL
jgi:serine/threonine protein kinase